jgi:hypothetical protein
MNILLSGWTGGLVRSSGTSKVRLRELLDGEDAQRYIFEPTCVIWGVWTPPRLRKSVDKAIRTRDLKLYIPMGTAFER